MACHHGPCSTGQPGAREPHQAGRRQCVRPSRAASAQYHDTIVDFGARDFERTDHLGAPRIGKAQSNHAGARRGRRLEKMRRDVYHGKRASQRLAQAVWRGCRSLQQGRGPGPRIPYARAGFHLARRARESRAARLRERCGKHNTWKKTAVLFVRMSGRTLPARVGRVVDRIPNAQEFSGQRGAPPLRTALRQHDGACSDPYGGPHRQVNRPVLAAPDNQRAERNAEKLLVERQQPFILSEERCFEPAEQGLVERPA